jgi:hypothetical protein
MKKVLLSLGFVVMATGFSFAQDDHAGHDHGAAVATTSTPAQPAAPSTTLKPENMDFKTDIHDFGTVQEGGDIEYDFVFKNTGKEPIILNAVTASCGCTAPSWSKDPVLPGKSNTIKAVYHTQGRIGPFNKAITVVSNAGSKVITIKGTVEKAPETSVPQNKSMVKMN